MDGLPQFLVSIFHFRGDNKAAGKQKKEDKRHNEQHPHPLSLSLISFFFCHKFVSHFIGRPPWSDSRSLCTHSLISLHFNLISASFLSISFSQHAGDVCYVLPLPHIHPQTPSSLSPSSNHDAWQALHQSSSPATPSPALLQWILQPSVAMEAQNMPPL